MTRAQAVAFAAIGAAATLVLVLALRGRQPPVLPADDVHAPSVGEKDCSACHGPDGPHPPPANHTPRTDCLACHGRP